MLDIEVYTTVMKKSLFFAPALILFLLPSTILAHSGRTDSSGGHNCNVGSCAGTYHYHNGGGGYTPPVIDYSYLKPNAVKSGNQNYYTSADNWCNYDVIANWDSVSDATGYSVSLTKTAGGNPGNISDTSNTSFTFENYEAGTWYLNVKSGNRYGWSDVVYWTITLPKMTPIFDVNLIGDTVNYDFSCQSEIKAPQFVIDGMKNMGNSPKGSIKIQNTTAVQDLMFSGTDRTGKTYSKTLVFTPKISQTPTPQVQGAKTTDITGSLISLGLLGGLTAWLWKQKSEPKEV